MTKRQLQTGVAVVVALAVIGVFFIFNPFTTLDQNQQAAVSTSATSLVVQDEIVGTGTAAQTGDEITVNYTGKLANGTVFDTSVGKVPFQFQLGVGKVIQGWDQGLVGMKVGGKRILIIPPNMAYGPQGVGPIPPNSTLTFEVELLNVAPATASPAATQ